MPMRTCRSSRSRLFARSLVDHRLPGAQQVAAEDLADVGFAVAALAQACADVAGLRGIHPAGDAAATIEIRGDAHVVDAGDPGDVVDVVEVFVESGERMRGRFLVTRLDYAGDYNGERNYTLNLESSGAVVSL